MSIQFRCPACGNGIEIADDRAGQPVECPRCATAMMAPAPGETVPMPVAPQVIPYSGRIEVPRGDRWTLWWILLWCCGGAAALLMIAAVLHPAIVRVHVLSSRTVCAANLSGIAKGLSIYAVDGNQGLPIAAHWPEQVATATGQVNYVGRIGSKRGVANQPKAGETSEVDGPDGREISTTRNLWTLVRMGSVMPASFICSEAGDQKNEEDYPMDYWDFGSGDVPKAAAQPQSGAWYKQVSYGYQVPYGRYGRPSYQGDPRCVLAADKGPFGIAAESGASAPPRPPAGLSAKSSPDDWRPWNSPNHGGIGKGEGQNILFVDGRVEWANKPLAGPKDDNIYTQWPRPDATEAEAIFGTAPSRLLPNLTPQADTDALIYP